MSENTNIQTGEDWKPSHSPWLVTAAIMIGTFISVLDSTVANVALPHMAGTFSATNEEALWIVTSYLIASGIILPSVAWFSKIFGRKNYYIGCIAIFTIASVLCGLSKSLDQMLLARIIQGIGGGALMPIAQAILLESFPREKRGLAMSVFGLGVLVAPIVGPLIGGWITDSFAWQWIFFINVPFGILAIILSKIYIEDPPYAKKQGFQKIDYVGFTFLILWLTTQQTVLDKGQNVDWFSSPLICTLTGITIFSIMGFFISQIKNKESIVDLSVFKDRNFAIGTAVMVVVMGVMYASIAIMPLFLQTLLGYSAFLSGYAVMPRGIGCIIGIVIIGIFSGKIDDRLFIVLGLIALGVSSIMFGFLSLDIAMINIVIPNLICGFAMGISMTALTTVSINTIKNSQMTNATGLQSLLKETGGAIGTSVVSTILVRFSQMHQMNMVGNLNDLNPVFAERVATYTAAFAQNMHISEAALKANYVMYAELVKQSTLWGYMDAFRIFGLIALLIIPIVFLIKKPKIKEEETIILN